MNYPDQFAPGFAGIVVGCAVVVALLLFVATQYRWFIPWCIKCYYSLMGLLHNITTYTQSTIEREQAQRREDETHGQQEQRER